MAVRRFIRLLKIEKEDLIKAATEILSEYPLISPLDLFMKSQRVLAPERRRDASKFKNHREQYQWLYDSVKSSSSQLAEKPVVRQQRGAAKNLAASVNLEQVFGSRSISTDEELIQEFVRYMAPGPEESVDSRFKLIEDRLQGIERLLGVFTGAMRQALIQKKVSKGS